MQILNGDVPEGLNADKSGSSVSLSTTDAATVTEYEEAVRLFKTGMEFSCI